MIQCPSLHVDNVFLAVENAKSPSVVSSWRRCLKLYGLRPNETDRPEKQDHWRIVEAQQKSEDLIAAAKETMDHLLNALNGPDYIVFLTDPEGVVLDSRSLRASDFWKRPRGDWVGTDFSEQRGGTNGIGTVLREKRAMTVAADQHFLVRNLAANCSGAPIFGPDGELAGCIDVTSSARRADTEMNSLILAATVEAARCIEMRLFSDTFPGAEIMFASPTGWQAAGALAVDRSGCVVGATRAARLRLQLTPIQLNGTYSAQQLRQIDVDEDLSLQAAEQRAIHAALTRCNGNASAAARVLRISRSTLLRKIAEIKKSEAVARIPAQGLQPLRVRI